MSDLKEAAMRKALKALEVATTPLAKDRKEVLAAMSELRTALAQQGEQQPVAWYEYNQDLDAWFLAYGYNPKAKTRPLVFGDTAAPAPVAQAPFNESDAAMWLTKNKLTMYETLSAAPLAAPVGINGLTEAETSTSMSVFGLSEPAPQLAQPHNADPSCTTVALAEMILSDCGCSSNNTALVSRVANRIDAALQSAQQAQEPTKFLANGTRFKTSKFPGGVCITGMPDELAGRWVALVAAEDNCHLQSAQPVAQDVDYKTLYEGTLHQLNQVMEAIAQPVAPLTVDDFEEWHKANFTQSLARHGYTYSDASVRNRWIGWQAAHGKAPAPLTDDAIWFLWASENAMEECNMCKLDDFKKVFRYVEKACGIKGAK